jgi:hypothetical protein
MTRCRLAWGKLRLSTAYLLPPLSKIGSAKFRRFVVNIIPWKDVHDVRDIVDVLTDTSIKIFDIKTKALTEGDEALATQIGRGKDIMSILSAFIQATIYLSELTHIFSESKYVSFQGR